MLFAPRSTHRLQIVRTLLVLVLALAAATAAHVPRAHAADPPPAGDWDLAFEDDFEGTTLDGDKWVTCWNWGTNEQGCNNNPGGRMLSWVMPRNVSVGDGSLQLRTVKEKHTTPWDGRTYDWTSGMVTSDRLDDEGRDSSRFAFQYGYMETRMKMPTGSGIYNAFWTGAEDHSWPPEIDVVEAIADRPDLYHQSVHWPTGGGNDSRTQDYVGTPLNDGDWHTLGVLWDPEKIVWYVDGKETTRFTDVSKIPAKQLHLLLSAEVWAGSTGWTKGPDSSTPAVTTTYVDYVRVWKHNGGDTVDAPPPPKVTPTARFGTAGIGSGTYDKASDGDTTTAFDAADGSICHTGVDAGGAVAVDTIRYWPRLYQGKRMIGGKFQASNSQGGPWTDLHTVSYWPGDHAFTTVRTGNDTPYRYYRYVGPPEGHCNIMEMEFRTADGT